MKISKIEVGMLKCNCYLLEKDNKCLLIDPGDEDEKIINFIKDHKILGILNTHHHFDHIGALKKLEEQGFVTRIKDENDKRSNKIYLNDKAKDVREGVLDVLNDWNKEITKSLTEEEEEMLKSLLEKVCKNINV